MPQLVGLFSYRFDAHLVPDLLSNLQGVVDAVICHDDRGNRDRWYHEGSIRTSLVSRARAIGAEWVLCMDPDERLEQTAGSKIRELIREPRKVIYGFRLREMWRPDYYRIDGIWGTKNQCRLFPLLAGQHFQNDAVHSGWMPIDPGYAFEQTELNIYHLKMMDAKSREARRDLYNALDPEKKMQPIGYDYLTDESGIVLEKVPEGREYFPPAAPIDEAASVSEGEAGEKQQILGKWEWRYRGQAPFAYAETESYEKAAAFLNGYGLVEDWGCGPAWARRFFTEYRGVDGSAGHADRVADLRQYRSEVPCILMRHVLEHNHEWRRVLRNAVESFSKRMVIVLFTPFAEQTKQIAKHWADIPDYSFARADLFSELTGLDIREETLASSTVYGLETMLYISRPA